MARISEVVLKARVDKQSLAQAKTAISGLAAEQNKLATAAAKSGGASAQSSNQVTRAANLARAQVDESRVALKRVEHAAEEAGHAQADAARLSTAQWEAFQNQVRATNKELGKTSTIAAPRSPIQDMGRGGKTRNIEALGDISSLTSAASFVGGGGSQLISDITGALEYLPRGAQGLAQLGRSALGLGAQTIDAAGNVTQATASFGQVAGKAAVLGVAGVALAGAAVVGALALRDFTKGMQEQTRAAQAAVAAERDLNQQSAAGSLTTEEINRQREEQNRLLEFEQKQLEDAKAARAAYNEAFDDSIIHEAFAAGARALDSREQAIADAQNAASTNIANIEATLRELDQAATDGRTALADLKIAQEEQARAAQELEQKEAQLAAERTQAAQSLAQAIEAEQKARRDIRQQESELAQDRSIQTKRDNQDYANELQKANQRAQATQREGLKRIEDLRAQSGKEETKRVKTAQESITKQITTTRNSAQKLETDYEASRLKSLAQFTKERIRAVEDLKDQEFDAILSNDIQALAQAQRNAEKEKERATTDFTDEQTLAQQQKDARLAEIEAEGQARIDELRAKLIEENTLTAQALDERIAAEQTALAERVAAEKAAEDERDAARQLRLERQTEDEDLADKRRHAQQEEQLDALEQQRLAAQETFDAIEADIRSLADVSVEIFTDAFNRIRVVYDSASISGHGSFGGGGNANKFGGSSGGKNNLVPKYGTPKKLADGGLARAGMGGLGYFEPGRSYNEAIIPLRDDVLSKIAGAMGGGGTVNHWNITIGANSTITKAEVRDAILQAEAARNRGTARARAGLN